VNDTTGLTPYDLARAVEQNWGAWLERDRRVATPHPQVWASAYRECERRMVLELTVPDQQLPFPVQALARFRRGNDRERDLLVDMARIGRDADPTFVVHSQQERFELKGRTGGVVITGKVDARLRVGNMKTGAPLEVKAWSQNIVDRIDTFDDVYENMWTRSGAHQLLAYLYGANEPFGFLLLDRSGIPKLVVVELNDTNHERMEAFLARAERVVAAAASGTLPDYIDDPAECKRCAFYGTACNPPIASVGQDVLVDPELEADLERWWATRDAGRAWRDLDEGLKKRLRGVESAVAGHFAIAGRWGTYKRLELPPDIKKQYTIADPKGRFTLEIERL